MSKERIFLARHLRVLSATIMDEGRSVCDVYFPGLDPAWASMINHMDQFGHVSAMQMADMLQVSHVHTQKLLKAMVKDGAAKAEKDPADARRTNYSLTEKGQTYLPGIAALGEAIGKVLNDLQAETGVDLGEILKLYDAALTSKSWGARVDDYLK